MEPNYTPTNQRPGPWVSLLGMKAQRRWEPNEENHCCGAESRRGRASAASPKADRPAWSFTRAHPARLKLWLGIVLMTLVPSASHALHDVLEPLFAANVSGGTVGWHLKRLGGPVITDENPSFRFYPASSIKILHHLGAIRLAEFGLLDLDADLVPVCEGTTNCTDIPNAQVESCGVGFQFLTEVLEDMMQISDNESTNAVQELIGVAVSADPQPARSGRQFLTNMAQDLVGTSEGMRVLHKFNCDNVDNAPFENHATLADFSRLYEAIAARPDVIQPATRVVLKNRMLDENNSFFTNEISDLIDEEATDLGKTEVAGAFKDLVRLIYKNGSVSNSNKRYVSFAGLIQLPINNGNAKRIYSFAMFIEGADSVAGSTDRVVSRELLRPAVRSALQSWVPSAPGFAFQAIETLNASLQSIASEISAPAQQRAIREAIGSLEEAAAGLAGGEEPIADRVWTHLLQAQRNLDFVHRASGRRDVAALQDVLAGIAGHLSENAAATFAAESLHPRTESFLDMVDWVRGRAEDERARGQFLAATSSFRSVGQLAVNILGSPFQRDCSAYATSAAGCPESDPDVGLPESDGEAGVEGSGDERER